MYFRQDNGRVTRVQFSINISSKRNFASFSWHFNNHDAFWQFQFCFVFCPDTFTN